MADATEVLDFIEDASQTVHLQNQTTWPIKPITTGKQKVRAMVAEEEAPDTIAERGV